MTAISFSGLFLVAALAFCAPLLVLAAPRLRIPSAVVEILAGVVIGPSLLGWVHLDLPIRVLSMLGLAFLLLLAGLEIDFDRLRGRPLQLAAMGLLASIVIALAVGFAIGATGLVRAPLFLAIVLLATSLGLVVPVLQDARESSTRFGQRVIAGASMADFAAIIFLSLVFSAQASSPASRAILLIGFAASAALLAITILRTERLSWLSRVFVRLQDTTAQIRVRGSVLLLIGLVALAARFGVELLLASFMAGVVLTLVDRDREMTHPNFRLKLDAIGFGFLIPVFFIASGVSLDFRSLLDTPLTAAKIPLFLLALLAVRGLPAVLYLRSLGRRQAIAAGLLQATSLPFIVAATQIGLALRLLLPSTAVALVAAGVASVLFFPPAALALLSGARPTSSSERPSERPC